MPANTKNNSPGDVQSQLRSLLEQSSRCGELIRVVLSMPTNNAPETPQKLTVRPVELKGGLQFQASWRLKNQESHENLSAADMVNAVLDSFPQTFLNCHVFTATEDCSFKAKKGGKLRVNRSKPSLQRESTSHNRAKSYLIPDGQPCDFLAAIGVMTDAGRVHKSKYQKFRQINRFLELVNDVVDQLPDTGTLRVVDFGCGKSYLTFALHHLLTSIHRRRVHIVGLDRRADVIETCRAVSRALKRRDLEFRVGDIADHTADEHVNLAVSLHACDTATDDALAKAVGWNADVILAVPCCQHELAEKIHSDDLSSMLDHGLIRERVAALATDSLRAKALQACGYKTQLVEFIDMEHTPKNILIRAVRRDSLADETAGKQYESLKMTLGLQHIHVDRILDRRHQSVADSG
jgi:SAM-dependent methyltransferase